MDFVSIVGRESERRTLTAAIDDARRGRARALVLRGAAGIGKTALLDAVVADVASTVRTIRITRYPDESDLPYAGVHQFLHAVRRTPELTVPSVDPLRDASALLAIITSLAEENPLLIVVEDAQWLDRASRQVLAFVARRLDADPVCLLFSVRTAHAEPLQVGQTIAIGPLDLDESLRLLRKIYPDLTALVAARIARHAAGIPLALCEIPLDLTPAQRQGAQPLPADLPLGQSLAGLFTRRLDALTDRQRLALLAAAFDPLDASTYQAILAAVGCSVDDLDASERAGLVRVVQGRCVFRHPSVPAAIRHVARHRELVAVHRALAVEFAGDPMRAAMHLTHVPGVDRSLLYRTFHDAAIAAAEVHAHADAARFWEAASNAAAHNPEVRSCVFEAARSYVRAGAGPEARELLNRLLADTDDDIERAVLLRDLTSISLWSYSAVPEDSDQILAHGVALVGSADAAVRPVGIDLIVALATAALGAGDYRHAHELCIRLRTEAGSELSLEQRLLCDVAAVMVGASGAGATLRTNWTQDYPWHSVLDPATPAGFITVVLGWLGEDDLLNDVIRRCRAAIDAHGPSASGLYVAGSMIANREAQLGRWDRALEEFDALERLVESTDFTAPYPFIALRHAHLLAARGDKAGCDALRARARQRAPVWTRMMAHLDHCVAGLLALALRDFPVALDELGQAGAVEREIGLVPSGYLSRFADMFEAAWHLGSHQLHLDELREFEQAVERVGHHGMLGLATRCRALAASPDTMDERFGDTLTLLKHEPNGFDAARTRLLWGQRLRRARRKADANEQLSAARDVFARLGAGAWLQVCQSELAACGVRRVSGIHPGNGPLVNLTPREFEVAREVATGATNAQAAQRLFISERTVEFHLSRVYRKLGIRHRDELVRHFTD